MTIRIIRIARKQSSLISISIHDKQDGTSQYVLIVATTKCYNIRMAAAQSVDQKSAVIFQTIQRASWFSPNTFRSYIAALIMTPYLPDEEKKKLTVLTIREGDQRRVVNIETIRSELQQFVDKLSKFEGGEAIRQTFGLGTINVFSAVDLVHLRDAIDEIAAYVPAPPESNIPAHMREMVDEFERQKEAKVALGKKREDAIAEMDKLMWHRLELIRQVNAAKINAKTALSELFTSSQYLKDLSGLERDLGGRGYLEQFVQSELDKLFNQIVDVEKNPLEYRKLVELLSKDPTGSQAVSYLRHRIETAIDSHEFFRTAYNTAHPEAKKKAPEAIAAKAQEGIQNAQPHAQIIEQEREALRAEGVDPEELDALSYTRRPAEIRQAVRTMISVKQDLRAFDNALRNFAHTHHIFNDRAIQHLIDGAHHNLLYRDAIGRFLLKEFPGENISSLLTIAQRFRAIPPHDLLTISKLQPNILPSSVVRTLTHPNFNTVDVQDIAQQTNLPPDHVAAYAAGLNPQTLNTHLKQAKIGADHPAMSWFKNFREKSIPAIEKFIAPRPPAPAGAPEAPAISTEVANNFRQLSGANAFRTRIGQAFRFLGVDRAVNFVARSAPVRAITAPFRAVGNAVTSGVTGVKNWAKSQVIAGATSIGTKLVTWGAAQAAKAGIMGFAGQAASWGGKTLLAVAGGTALKSIPVIGQAIGAVQAVGGATLGFLGSTLDFIRGKKSFGEWGASAFKSAGTLIGAAVGGLLGGAIGLLGLGVGAIPGALIGVVIGAMVGGMLTGGLAAFAKKPEEVLKSLFGLLLIGGFAAALFAKWALTHLGALIGGTIGATIGMYFGSTALSILGFGLCGPLCAAAGWWVGGVFGGTIGAFVGMAVGTAVQWFFEKAIPQAGVAISQLATIGAVKGLGFLNTAATAAGQLLTLAGHGIASLFSFGQIALGKFIGWIGQAGWTLGGGILGGIAGIPFGPLGMVAGFGAGAGIGSWLGSGGLNSLLSGIGPAMTNSVVAATNFLGSLTAPLTASSIVATTTTVVLGGVAAAGGITALFVMPSILAALYVPGGETLGGFSGGYCPVPDTGYCSISDPVTRLTDNFGDQANYAAQICEQESGGYAGALNPNCPDYSVGLFQINLICHPNVGRYGGAGFAGFLLTPEGQTLTSTTGKTLRQIFNKHRVKSCYDAFTNPLDNPAKGYKAVCGLGASACSSNTITNQALLDDCFDWFKVPENNVAYAKWMSGCPSCNWGQWSTARECGIVGGGTTIPINDPLVKKVGQLILAGIPDEGKSLSSAASERLKKFNLGGVILLPGNIGTLTEVQTLTAQIRQALGDQALVAVDNEGGGVNWIRLGMPADTAQKDIDSADEAREVGEARATGLKALGVNFIMSPILEIVRSPSSYIATARGGRAFLDPGSNTGSSSTVTSYAQAMIEGYGTGGVVFSTKHFPGGLGRAGVDPHSGIPVVNISKAEMLQDVQPYVSLKNSLPSVMVTHLSYPLIDPDNLSSVSSVFIQNILRGEIGYNGVVLLDDITMGALFGRSMGQRAVDAIQAGADMMIVKTKDAQEQAMFALVQAVKIGTISEARIDQSLTRINILKASL